MVTTAPGVLALEDHNKKHPTTRSARAFAHPASSPTIRGHIRRFPLRQGAFPLNQPVCVQFWAEGKRYRARNRGGCHNKNPLTRATEGSHVGGRTAHWRDIGADVICQLCIGDEILHHRILLRTKTDDSFADTRPNGVVLISRKGKRGKNRDDGNSDHQFDKGEPFFSIHFHLPKMIFPDTELLFQPIHLCNQIKNSIGHVLPRALQFLQKKGPPLAGLSSDQRVMPAE